MKSENELIKVLYNERTLTRLEALSGSERQIDIQRAVSRQFAHFFNGYTQAFNKMNRRRGGLFQRPFKRTLIESNYQLLNTIKYIHLNPVKACLVDKPGNWKYSSFKEITSGKKKFAEGTQIISLYDDLENFLYCHHTR